MTRYALIALLTTLLITTAALAQGTAAGPSTVHEAELIGIAYAGGLSDPINGPAPYPIDLDPTGLPWRKSIVSTAPFFAGTGSFTMIETVLNVGTEPWFDWHEDVFSGALGVAWNSVMSVTVNGNPIAFNQPLDRHVLATRVARRSDGDREGPDHDVERGRPGPDAV